MKKIVLLFSLFVCLSQSYALSPGEKVLRTAEKMVKSKEVIRGTCWTYVDAVYRRAGYPRIKRGRVFQENKFKGPYAPAHLLKAGDWVYFINKENRNTEHSGIFVRWQDKANKKGVLISYSGMGRVPGRHGVYTLTRVYRIYRPVEHNVVPERALKKRLIIEKKAAEKSQAQKSAPKAQAKAQSKETQVAKKTAKPNISAGEQILKEGRAMLAAKFVVVGKSSDYVRVLYSRAGYPRSKRHIVFSSKNGKKGPYASTKMFRGGDWLCFINHHYKNSPHCAIFVRWVNRGKNEAEMISYAGENREAPARMKNYDLSSVYQVVRPK